MARNERSAGAVVFRRPGGIAYEWSDRSSRRQDIIRGGWLALLVLIAYWPVIQRGGFIWDDPEHVVNNYTLRDASGLEAIWLHPTSTPQYYPIVHSTFWIEYRLWQLHPAGYHIDNVLIHAAAAILLWRCLLMLKIPGSWLAAAIFALHPVEVESVAWITERKNVLSGLFYFASLLTFFHFRKSGKLYWLSTLFFIAALLSKSVTASLPAVILLLVYYQNGKITRRDVALMIPWFILGVAMAAVTSWLERTHVGASGAEWSFSPMDRILIAGRAVWFYGVKILWPVKLSFVYPRWSGMNLAARPAMILLPISVLGTIVALWLLRRRIGRGPLVACLFFCGTLVPALGFVNVFPMRYTFVADHYQYLAGLGVIVPLAAILCKTIGRVGWLVLIPVMFLTFHRGKIYQGNLALWLDTRAKNSNSWMVYENLGDEYISRGDKSAARECFEKELALAPDLASAHWKWATVLENENNWQGAKAELVKSIQLDPNSALSRASMGKVLMQLNEIASAIDSFKIAADLDPSSASIRTDYAAALLAAGRYDDARVQCNEALRLDPNNTRAMQVQIKIEVGSGIR